MKPTSASTLARVRAMAFGKVYPLYVAKVERKGRARKEVDQVLQWLTGYTPRGLATQIKKEVSLETFFENAPRLNPARMRVTGVVCGIRVENISDTFMREVRLMDKLIDELAQGKPMEKILRAE